MAANFASGRAAGFGAVAAGPPNYVYFVCLNIYALPTRFVAHSKAFFSSYAQRNSENSSSLLLFVLATKQSVLFLFEFEC